MTTHDFDTIIATDSLTLANFSATWCGPCRAMQPNIELLAHSHSDVNIVKIDIDYATHRELVARYNIVSVPTLILFRHSKILWRDSGVVPYEQLLSVVEEHQLVESI